MQHWLSGYADWYAKRNRRSGFGCHEPVGEAELDAGRAHGSANLVQLFDLTGTDRVSNLVRRAERRHHQSTGWRKTVQEVEGSLGLKTKHKA
jgi:hypothetical protein